MRKKLLLLAVSLLGMASAQAQTLGVDGSAFEVLKGKTGTLAIKVGSATNVRDVQFDITIPAGVELGTPAAGTQDYKVAISDATAVTGGNKYTVILYSETGEKGAADINFPLTVPADFSGELWANLTSSTADGKYTNDAATEAAATSTTYTFQVGLLGDANKDTFVDIADINTILDVMTDVTPERYSALAANANEDNTPGADRADVNAVLDMMAQ